MGEIFSPVNINSLGLLIDIVGVILLSIYGLPENIDRSGNVYRILEQADDAEKAKARHYDKMSALAISFLISGFVLQILSNYI